jgi:hypothetical protein
MIAELQTAISKVPSRKARLKGLTRVEAVKIKVERAAMLFRAAPVTITASALSAAIIMAVAWSDIEHDLLLAWAGSVMALAIARAVIWARVRLLGGSGRNMSRFAGGHIIFMAVNGALWGALGPIFAVHGLAGHPILPFAVAGTGAAAIVSAGGSWRAAVAFNIPALAPLAAIYALTAETDGVAIAGVVILYGVATVGLAFAMQRMVDRSILLHTKNNMSPSSAFARLSKRLVK